MDRLAQSNKPRMCDGGCCRRSRAQKWADCGKHGLQAAKKPHAVKRPRIHQAAKLMAEL